MLLWESGGLLIRCQEVRFLTGSPILCIFVDRETKGFVEGQGAFNPRCKRFDSSAVHQNAKIAPYATQFSGYREIKYAEAWKFKLSDVKIIKPDGSNFFEVAIRIT